MTGVAGAATQKAHAGKQSMRLALVGDLHDYVLAVWPWELLGKPLAGQANLWLNRRRRFDRSLIAPTMQRLAMLKPDLLLFSGDLTTTSRPREFASIASALQPLLDAFPAVIAPGNHDRYTFTAERTRRIERAFPQRVPEIFPQVRSLFGRWRLVTVNAATPRLLDSRGRIGPRQLQHVDAALRSLTADEGVIVLCHYPFGNPPQLPPMKDGHRLMDEDAWRDTIAACRAQTVIVHGHVHCPWLWRPTDMPRVLDVNAGAPTMTVGGWPRGQGFWIMGLPADAAQPIEFEHHIITPGEGPIAAHGQAALPPEQEGAWTLRRLRT